MTKTLTRQLKHWYGLGQFAEGLKNDAFSVFLLFYYTTVLGLSGVLAGQAILIALLFDAITDPLIGVLSDRLDTRWGRRHPLLAASALPLPICFYYSFAPPEGLSQLQLFAWLAVFTVLTRAAMTLFHVPHLALGAELSADFEERSQIVTLQMIYSRIGATLSGALGLLVFLRPTEQFPDGRFNADAYPDFALTLSIMMFVVIVLTTWRTAPRIPHLGRADAMTQSERPLANLVRGVREASHLRSFRSLFSGTLVMFIAWGVVVSLGLHLATYFWQVTTTQLLIWGLVIPAICRITGFWPEVGSPLYIPLYALTTGFLTHFGIAATMVTGRSMMADVTDEDELRSGRRREGLFFGATSFAAKACFGIGSQIAGVIYDGVGLKQGMSVADAPLTVMRDLGVTLTGSILVLVGLSLLIFSRYDLTRSRCREIREQLDARQD